MSEARTAVPLIHHCDLDTYYVSVCIGSGQPMNYLVDTGAGYMTVTGGTCTLRDVEVAVLSGAPRGLFGLSALRQAAPFEFSLDPPSLMLSNCVEAVSAPAQEASCPASPPLEAQRSCIESRFDPLVHP